MRRPRAKVFTREEIQAWVQQNTLPPPADLRPQAYISPTDASALEALGLRRLPRRKDAISAAYRAAAKRVHPDVGGSPALFRKVRSAYEHLVRRLDREW